MPAPRKVDYDLMESDWRAGIKSIPQIAAEYESSTGVKVSKTAISKHFEALGVPRDLGAKIKAKADAMVAASMVTGKVTAATEKKDAEIIAGGALVVANVQVSHRADISRSRALAVRLMDELEQHTADPTLFRDLRQSIDDGDSKSIQKALDSTLSLGSRVKVMKDLADTLRTLIGLEREAYSLDSIPDAAPPPERVDPVEGARRLAFVLRRAQHEIQAQHTIQ